METDMLIEWAFGMLVILSSMSIAPVEVATEIIAAKRLDITVNDIGVSAIDDHLTFGILSIPPQN